MKDLKDQFIEKNIKRLAKKSYNARAILRELLDSSCQRVKRFFVLAYNNTDDDANRVDADSFKNISFQE